MNSKLGDDLGIDQREKQQLVEELQLAKRSTVQRVRNVASAVLPITVKPADSMNREQAVVGGMTRDLRSRSVVAHLTRPVEIGGFYQLTIDSADGDVPTTFARCDQITLLAEDRFETRFQFLQPIVLPGDSASTGD